MIGSTRFEFLGQEASIENVGGAGGIAKAAPAAISSF
jgi:hypothetical protein